MRNSEIAISIKGLTKFYKNFQALDKISFEVKRGDFFAFLGPNGAGKTTTINVLTGLSNYQSGDVRVFGYDVTCRISQHPTAYRPLRPGIQL